MFLNQQPTSLVTSIRMRLKLKEISCETRHINLHRCIQYDHILVCY